MFMEAAFISAKMDRTLNSFIWKMDKQALAHVFMRILPNNRKEREKKKNPSVIHRNIDEL